NRIRNFDSFVDEAAPGFELGKKDLQSPAQQSAFAVGVLSDLYAFHRSTGNSLCPYHTPAW
ncbi:hypothetical protein Tco_1189459, partial [Tanacetum coccineum]